MSTITRDLPETIDARAEALHLAQNKLNSIPAASNPLTAATTGRLNAMVTDFDTKAAAVITAKAAYNSGTPGKESSATTLRMFISHFIQVFNLGVARGKYPAAHRAYYDLAVDSNTLPDLVTEADLLLWGNKLVSGDPNRMAAGGLIMNNPDIGEVQTALTNFNSLFTSQSNLKDALDTTQETLEDILEETDKVIKKVWDELDTFYNEETDESRRENCREWGVVYITIGGAKVLSGTVTYNGAPGAGLQVRFKQGKNKSICTAASNYSLNTTLMGNQKVVIEKLNNDEVVIKTWEFEITLNENGDKTENFTVND